MFCAAGKFLNVSGLHSLSGPPLQINRYVTFGLALQAGIAHGSQPLVRLTIVFQAPVLNWLMKSLTYIVEHDPGFFVACQRKTHTIGASIGRHVAAPAGIADIAELTQLGFGRGDLFNSGAAGAGKSGAERQTSRKRPADGNSFGREEEGTRHNCQS